MGFPGKLSLRTSGDGEGYVLKRRLCCHGCRRLDGVVRDIFALEAKTMTTPNTEPNSLPPLYDDWQDWRATYADHVEEFRASPKTCSDVLMLKIRLKRLGFVGVNLDREIEFIKENAVS